MPPSLPTAASPHPQNGADVGTTAVYTGSFDPITLGHLDVIVALAILHVARALGRRLGGGKVVLVGRVVDDATRRHCAIFDS